MNKPEPTRLKLNPETPSAKDVNKIRLPSLNKDDTYNIDMKDDIYIRPDNDSIYVPVKKKD
jgi:hypothetical protein